MKKIALQSRKRRTRFLLRNVFIVNMLLFINYTFYAQHDFVHPGVAWNLNDLDQMAAHRNIAPWSDGWEDILATDEASLDYNIQGGFDIVSNKPGINQSEHIEDSQAALYHALQWYFTRDEAHGRLATDILDAWATTHVTWSGTAIHLTAAWRGGTMVQAAEILRYTYPGWTAQNTENCENYFENILYPQFRVPDPLRAANQGANNLWGAVQIAIFLNDQEKFQDCLDAYLNDPCAGISNSLPNGQCGDTGRDQGHAAGMIGNLASVAQNFWVQGIDVYGAKDNRLLKIMEYWAEYNLGGDVQFIDHGTCYGYYTSIGDSGRSANYDDFNGTLENIRGAYVVRKGLEAPYTLEYISGVNSNEATFLSRKDVSFTTTASPSEEPYSLFTHTDVTNLTSVEIGNQGQSGSRSFDNGTWTISGSGNGINEKEISYHYAYIPVKGDGEFIAQVKSIDDGDSNASAGVVIRRSLEDAQSGMGATYATLESGTKFSSRNFVVADGNGSQTFPLSNLQSGSVWVKVERRGNRIVGYVGPDGVTWAPMQHSIFDNLENELFMGLVVSSSNNSKLTTATFTDVQVSTSEIDSSCANTTTKIEAECFDDMLGIEIQDNTLNGKSIAFIENQDWVRYNDIDLTDIHSFQAIASSNNSGGEIEVHLDTLDGELLTTITITNTTGWNTYESFASSIDNVDGTHDVYLKFVGNGGFLFNLDRVGFFEENILSNQEFENTANQVIIYPNPVQSTVTIQGVENATIRIYDMNGKRILIKHSISQNETLDLSQLSVGIYYAQVNRLEDTQVLKIVKK